MNIAVKETPLIFTSEVDVMIRKIMEDELQLIEPLISEFNHESDSPIPPNFIETVKSSVKDGKAFIYGAFSDSESLDGFGIFGNVSKRISFVYAGGNSVVENDLIDAIFKNHSSECSFIHAGGPSVTEAISEHLVSIGFRKLDRAYMTLNRKSIEALENPVLPEDMTFEIYTNSHTNELAQVMFKSNDGHIDQIVFPNFFESIEACKKLIDNITNHVYGDYKEPYSWLLREKGKLIGACMLTILKGGDTGYIPDIVIDPDYQGRRLGKAILVHSMKKILAGESDIVKVDLDVTLENDARFLYKSLGYEIVREYSMYTWLNKENN